MQRSRDYGGKMLPYTTKGYFSRGRPVHSVLGPPVSIINKCPMDMSTSQPAGGIASAEVFLFPGDSRVDKN